MGEGTVTVLIVALIAIFSLLFYFLPAIVGRRKRNAGAIFLLNLLLGWTMIGWIVALVWAACKDPESVK